MNKIKPSKKGTFTKTAKAHGKSVSEFENQVLSHKENYSPEMVKKANFSHNARKWNKKSLGGDVDDNDPFMQDFLAKRIANRQNNAWVGLNNNELPTNDLTLSDLSLVRSTPPFVPTNNVPVINPSILKFKTKSKSELTIPELSLSGYKEANSFPGYKNDNSFKIIPQTSVSDKETYYPHTNTVESNNPKIRFSLDEDWVNKAPHISPLWSNSYLNRATYHFNTGNDALFRGLGKVIPKAGGGIRVDTDKQGSFFTPSNFNLLPLDPSITNAPADNLTYIQPNNLPADTSKLQANPELNIETPYITTPTLNNFNNYSSVGSFVKAGSEHALAGINAAKGIVDTIGDIKTNNFTKKRELDTYKQAVYSDATNVTPYETQGYNWRGRNQLFELGGNISIDKYNTDKNGFLPIIEAEKGELAKTPEGLIDVINSGEKHSNGGTPMNLPNNSVILSEKLKINTLKGKKSFTDLGKPFQTEKELKLLKNNKVDSLTKDYATEAINMKKQKIDEIFQLQEYLKEQGYFGKDVQLQTINEKLPKAGEGTKINISNQSYSPAEAEEIIKQYKNSPVYAYINDAKNLTEGKKRLKEQLQLNKSLSPELSKKIDSAKSFQELNPIAGTLQEGTWKLHPEAAKHYGLNIAPTRSGLDFLVKNNIIDPNDFPTLFRNGKPIIGSMKDFPNTAEAKKLSQIIDSKIKNTNLADAYAEANYKDSEWYYRNPEFKEFAFKSKEDFDKYVEENKSNKYGDYFYSGTEGLYLKPTYPQQTPPADPPKEKIVFKDRPVKEYVNVPGDINYDIDIPNLNVPLGFPLPYGRTPLNYYKVEPNYIDPRYLDVQPQLNEINRGVRTFQTNLGDRTSANKANALQSQVNAYNQENQVYGQKYNYDRSQDAQAQQFNAQAKTNTDQFNEHTWYNQLENPIRMRESVIADQILTDLNKGNERYLKENQFYNNKNYIDNLLTSEFNPEDLINVISLGIQAQKDEKKKTTTKQKSDGSTEVTTTTVPKDKYGGKVKIKPKIKKY